MHMWYSLWAAFLYKRHGNYYNGKPCTRGNAYNFKKVNDIMSYTYNVGYFGMQSAARQIGSNHVSPATEGSGKWIPQLTIVHSPKDDWKWHVCKRPALTWPVSLLSISSHMASVTTHWRGVSSILGQRLRRWPSIEPTPRRRHSPQRRGGAEGVHLGNAVCVLHGKHLPLEEWVDFIWLAVTKGVSQANPCVSKHCKNKYCLLSGTPCV